MPGLVLSTVTPHGGQVKLGNGEVWTARTPHDSPATSLEPGTRIVLSVVDGATAVVVPVPTHPAPLGEQKE
jgi:membrane protein implicated in regulation of membrane protease activity